MHVSDSKIVQSKDSLNLSVIYILFKNDLKKPVPKSTGKLIIAFYIKYLQKRNIYFYIRSHNLNSLLYFHDGFLHILRKIHFESFRNRKVYTYQREIHLFRINFNSKN